MFAEKVRPNRPLQRPVVASPFIHVDAPATGSVLCPLTSAVRIAEAIMTDSSRPSLPPPSDADGSATSETASDSAHAPSSDASPTPTSLDAAQANIPEPFREAVSALREQTQRAAETIRALRAENQRLRDKVEELSQRPDVGDDDAFAYFGDDREAFRQRIQHFIDAIDDHLDNAPESGVASGDIDPLPLQPAEEPPREEPATTESGSEVATNESLDDRVSDEDVYQDGVSRDGVSQDSVSRHRTSEDGVSENKALEERLYSEDPAEEGSSEDVQSEAAQPGEESLEEISREADPLADGLPDAAHFEVEVPDALDARASDPDASAQELADEPDDSDSPDSTPPDEPILIAPGLSPRRSARRSARRGRRR